MPLDATARLWQYVEGCPACDVQPPPPECGDVLLAPERLLPCFLGKHWFSGERRLVLADLTGGSAAVRLGCCCCRECDLPEEVAVTRKHCQVAE